MKFVRTTIGTPKNLALWLSGDNEFTNYGFRIAYYIWTLKGSNSLEDLEYYSEHVSQFTDNFFNLRGAYGPRMMNWVGADQLQEALNANADLEDLRDYVKPHGTHQLEAVYNDLNDGMTASSIIIRDPSIDFDESNDIPDLLAVTFAVADDKITANLLYESVEYEEKVWNDLWIFSHIVEMLRSWLLLESSEVELCVCSAELDAADLIPVQYIVDVKDLEGHIVDGETKSNGSVIHPNPNRFWVDFEKLDDFEKHLRFRIKGDSFQNEAVSTTKLAEDLIRLKLSTMESEYLVELGYALLIFAFVKYAWETSQEAVFEWLNKIKNEALKREIVEHLALKSEPTYRELNKLIVG